MKRLVFGVLTAFALLAPAAEAGGKRFPASIALPPEFRPEGIASGRGTDFYVGSIPQGSVYKGDYRTGRGAVLVPPHAGRNHTGLKYVRGHLYVSGGASKGIYVYNARTGADVRAYSIPDAGFVNDVAITRGAAYFTDSQVQRLYKLPIGRDGSPGELEILPLTGALMYTPNAFNANGIAASRDGKTLFIVKSNDGKLFAADAGTGVTREIALDQPVTMGDGLLLHGHKLWVVRNRANQLVALELRRDLASARTVRTLTDPRFDVPTTIASFGGALYAVNARFDRPDTSDEDVVRIGHVRGHRHGHRHHR
jgi:outer membrane protein assembly factor BamB